MVSSLGGVLVVLVVGAVIGAAFMWVVLQGRYAAQLAASETERAMLREQSHLYADQLHEARALADEQAQVAHALSPLRETMTRVERQVGLLERDRLEHYGQLAERLAEVSAQTGALRRQTADLTGALNASSVRGAWGEAQLRRLCEHAGMLPQCDFDEQVRAVSDHDEQVRPDVVVRLPGDRYLVIDAKAPMSAFLSAQADDVDAARRHELLAAHAKALRGHVDALAAKRYWSAFPAAPEMVICFVPADAVLAAALSADPGLYDAAQTRKVVLASPATLLAMLRSIAFAWRQDALSTNARELLRLGAELHDRLGSLGGHVTKMGTSLRRSVESYNLMVGSLESRVLVSARKLHELGLASGELVSPTPLEATPRPLTAVELLHPEEPGLHVAAIDGQRAEATSR
ncbi:hypothetical protein KEM60_02095 [Austwickia sp. TVS 96-490-7B]|uniref:DNA recombination protein RmuC n=1 Tax=Austwickia sp. TVS 96-490-7B TaxID=2830843 RepID=UPI001C59AE69|nr:DNA recombination protein RmuC [Austwickia sp. TVS 96-490-7B]MBW3085884.1 hypothetical protein [Austwickia sp. TVS 96-490-7B]